MANATPKKFSFFVYYRTDEHSLEKFSSSTNTLYYCCCRLLCECFVVLKFPCIWYILYRAVFFCLCCLQQKQQLVDCCTHRMCCAQQQVLRFMVCRLHESRICGMLKCAVIPGSLRHHHKHHILWIVPTFISDTPEPFTLQYIRAPFTTTSRMWANALRGGRA